MDQPARSSRGVGQSRTPYCRWPSCLPAHSAGAPIGKWGGGVCDHPFLSEDYYPKRIWVRRGGKKAKVDER